MNISLSLSTDCTLTTRHVGTNYAHLIADLFIYYYESHFMVELSKFHLNRFKITFRYLDGIFVKNLFKNFFMISFIYDIEPNVTKDLDGSLVSSAIRHVFNTKAKFQILTINCVKKKVTLSILNIVG